MAQVESIAAPETAGQAVPTPSVIRSRIEETALQDCLRASMGGYTKKSVQEYVSRLRRQQQLMGENFNLELKRMLDEKEQLVSENSLLSAKLDQTASQYRTLTETITACKVENTEYTLDDVIALKTALESSRNDCTAMQTQLSQKDQQIAQLSQSVLDHKAAGEHAAQETRTCQELLVTEKKDAAALKQTILKMQGRIDEQKAQIDYLSGIVSEGNVAELQASLDAMAKNASLQEELISRKDAQYETSRRENALLSDQLAGLRDTASHLADASEQLTVQNEKLTAANASLTEQLEQALSRAAALLAEKAQLNAEKLLAERRLEAARLRLSNAEAGVAVPPARS